MVESQKRSNIQKESEKVREIEMGIQSVPGAALVLDVAEVWLCNVPLGSWGDVCVLTKEIGPLNLS